LLLSGDGKESVHTRSLQAFLHFGFHGPDAAMQGSSDVDVVADLEGGQFDLQWCSVRCMREWLLRLLREVESRAGQSPLPD
jgi:hypothetical protein